MKKSGGDRYCKHFTAWKQFLTLLFAQIIGKDSLREIENASVYYQQFPHCSVFNRRYLQTTMANRTLFQMDQAEFENQKLSRDKRKRCDVANLGGDDPLSADCLSQISAWVQIGDDGADKPYS